MQPRQSRLAKFNVKLPPAIRKQVQALAEQDASPMADILRDALTTYLWIIAEHRLRHTLALRDGEGYRDVFLPTVARLAALPPSSDG